MRGAVRLAPPQAGHTARPAGLEGEQGSKRGNCVKKERGRTGVLPSLLSGPAGLGGPRGDRIPAGSCTPAQPGPRCPVLPAVTWAKHAVPAHTRAF